MFFLLGTEHNSNSIIYYAYTQTMCKWRKMLLKLRNEPRSNKVKIPTANTATEAEDFFINKEIYWDFVT